MKKIIKNGKVFDGISNKIKQQDILIIDGVIQIGKRTDLVPSYRNVFSNIQLDIKTGHLSFYSCTSQTNQH